MLNLKKSNEVLLGKFVHNVYHGMVSPLFEGRFANIYDIHERNTRISKFVLNVDGCDPQFHWQRHITRCLSIPYIFKYFLAVWLTGHIRMQLSNYSVRNSIMPSRDIC